tara:strand:- start:90 stop:512 length:423 start_codon:yes stop_codon:yes gene_type:complete
MKITLTSIENKMSKSGAPFWVVKDNNGGSHTVWDKDLCDKLIFGQPMDLLIKEANGFSNIRGVGEKQEAREEKIVNTLPSPQIQTEINKPRTTRYATEVGAGELLKVTEKIWSKETPMDWDTAQEMAWNTYQEFKKRLGE